MGPEALQGGKEGCSPGTDHKQGAEEDDGVDAEASGAVPVGVWVEIEPDGELVESEGGADSIADGHDAAEEDGGGGVGASEVEEPAIADDEEDENSPDEVVDVLAPDHDPSEGTFSSDDEADEQPDTEEGDKEGDGGEEDAAAGAVWNGSANQVAEARELQQDEQDRADEGDEGEEQQSSRLRHGFY